MMIPPEKNTFLNLLQSRHHARFVLHEQKILELMGGKQR